MFLIDLVIVVLFLVLGTVFHHGKCTWLIAGYNTASPAEKRRYDEAALCRFMGKLMFSLAACWLVIAFGTFSQITFLFWVGFVLFLVVTFAAVIYANTGGRFKK